MRAGTRTTEARCSTACIEGVVTLKNAPDRRTPVFEQRDKEVEDLVWGCFCLICWSVCIFCSVGNERQGLMLTNILLLSCTPSLWSADFQSNTSAVVLVN